ncbi:uncharacterized protein PHALS_00839 [Plasmopara halstedii]|uniref:Uncharacterized protein n=1 Tax=Plasmopara halstedii TaxID=4781 RepID=A0A0P1ATR7_PLAHL|nr:uncharacterized protein PHALS_00839 [Plasmopara halstedii]CEG44476.1 hypothetical protein PHALS_00839 [Plasmopara halstedii]|eukprot:XP_024580845.1 hypothetical protein PHALS_00839 [Plasmopara halstedii]
MGLAGITVGTLFGLSTKLGSNVLQKVPYMRHPWEHVFFMGIGAGLGSYMQNKYYRDLAEVEELRAYIERREEMKKNA